LTFESLTLCCAEKRCEHSVALITARVLLEDIWTRQFLQATCALGTLLSNKLN